MIGRFSVIWLTPWVEGRIIGWEEISLVRALAQATFLLCESISRVKESIFSATKGRFRKATG